MNGHDRRKQKISEQIKKTALELFKARGVASVSMDEIAAQADVSKVTIYKYFHSKEVLFHQVMNLYIDEIMAETERMLAGDQDIVEKLKILMLAQANAPQLTDSTGLSALLNPANPDGSDQQSSLKNRIRDLMYRIYQEGIREGYIDPGLSFDLLNLYSEIFQAGFQSKAKDLEAILANPATFEQLQQLFFFGIIKKSK